MKIVMIRKMRIGDKCDDSNDEDDEDDEDDDADDAGRRYVRGSLWRGNCGGLALETTSRWIGDICLLRERCKKHVKSLAFYQTGGSTGSFKFFNK